MRKSFFITGTDTGVGKTTVACALARAFTKKNLAVGVMKPVETGCAEENGTLTPMDALKLKQSAASQDPLDMINPYRFAPPLAPSVAAGVTGATIDFKKIKSSYEKIAKGKDVMIVEGAGGLLVPLSRATTVADLITYLALPLIIVAASRLGCINHTLLTAEYAAQAGLQTRAILLNHPDETKDESRERNLDEIQKHTNVPIIIELPFQKQGELDLTALVEELIRSPAQAPAPEDFV